MHNEEYKLNESTELIFRGINVKENLSDGISYYEITMKDFDANNITLPDSIKENGDKNQITFKKLKKGDIIIPSRASLTNKIAIFDIDTDKPCIVNHQYWILRPNDNLLDSYYLLFFLLNEQTKAKLNNNERNITKTGMVAVSKESLHELKMKLPTIEIQKKFKDYFLLSQNIYSFIKNTESIHNDLYSNIYQVADTDTLQPDIDNIISIMDTANSTYTQLISHLK